MKRPSDKLNFKKLGSYKILKKIEPINFKLKLLKNNKVYLIFHVALLELAPQDIFLTKIINAKEYED